MKESDYNFPEGLYVRIRTLGTGVVADVYSRVEGENQEVIHMKSKGFIPLKYNGDGVNLEDIPDITIKDLTKKLKRIYSCSPQKQLI